MSNYHWVVPQDGINLNGDSLYRIYTAESHENNTAFVIKLASRPLIGLYTEQEVKLLIGELK